MHANAERPKNAQEIGLQQQLNTYFYPAKIEQDLRDNYILHSSKRQLGSPEADYDYTVLRQGKVEGCWPPYEDTEFLTNLPYLHGMLLHFPFKVRQAHLIHLAAGTCCNIFDPIKERLCAYSHSVIINITQPLLSRCTADADEQPLSSQGSLILRKSQEVELTNNNRNMATVLLLEINVAAGQ